MPAFAINVIDRAGVRRILREDAPSEAILRVHLRAQSLWPVRIREVPTDRKLARLVLSAPEFIGLLHQLELQLRAGVNADTALGQLAADAPPGAMRLMLEKILREVAQGTPIHVACRFFERQFPPHLAAVVSAGEASAQLPAAIRALAAHVGNNAELRRTARRALIYPVVVLIATTALIGFLLGGVVPQFAAIFTSLHLTLPAVTVALIAASDFVRHGWPAVVALLVGAVGVAGVGGELHLAAGGHGIGRRRDRGKRGREAGGGGDDDDGLGVVGVGGGVVVLSRRRRRRPVRRLLPPARRYRGAGRRGAQCARLDGQALAWPVHEIRPQIEAVRPVLGAPRRRLSRTPPTHR